MSRTLDELDRIAHDPCQLTLLSFNNDRGPYPGHPASGAAPAG
jgi:hypothetical protein